MAWRVQITTGDQEGESHFLRPEINNIIGRDLHNTISIRDKTVSRAHFLIRREGDQWMLEDLGSTNGTFLNEERISESALKVGDVIRAGMVKCQILHYSDTEQQDSTVFLDQG